MKRIFLYLAMVFASISSTSACWTCLFNGDGACFEVGVGWAECWIGFACPDPECYHTCLVAGGTCVDGPAYLTTAGFSEAASCSETASARETLDLYTKRRKLAAALRKELGDVAPVAIEAIARQGWKLPLPVSEEHWIALEHELLKKGVPEHRVAMAGQVVASSLSGEVSFRVIDGGIGVGHLLDVMIQGPVKGGPLEGGIVKIP